MFIMQVGGKVDSIFNSQALHPVQATPVLMSVFAEPVSGLIFSKCDSGLCSGQL